MSPPTVPFALQLHRAHPSGFDELKLNVPVLQRLHCLPVTSDLQEQVPF